VVSLSFFNDPDQKPALALFLKTLLAMAICLAFMVLSGVEAWKTITLWFETDADIGFFDALSISIFLTFLVYGFLVLLDPETILGKYRVVWSLLGLKTFLTASFISAVV